MSEQILFTRGVPADESFPIEAMAMAAQNAVMKYGKVILQYGKANGFIPLVEWLADWQNVSPDQVLTSNGSLQIVEFMGHAFLEPGDLVFTEVPTYDRTITLLRRHKAEIVGIPLQPDGVDMEALEQALKQAVPKFFYVIPDFQNPSGSTYSLEKRQRLVELSEKYGFTILEDAPYRPLRFRGEEQPSLFQMAPERVLHMLSFSKLIGPGPRVGFIVGNADTISQLATVANNTYIAPALFSQGAVYEFLNQGLLPAQIESLKALYAPRLDAVLTALDKYLPEASTTRPDGGFFLSVFLPGNVTTNAVREKAKAYDLILADGEAFFPSGGGEHFLRLPYCALTPEQLDEGVARLAKAVADVA
ncbi:MAG: PLP-dependent aminotransferase family protein [Chloroflexota bacterium]